MLKLVDMDTTPSATGVKHYSVEEIVGCFRFSLTTIPGAKPQRYISWAVKKMQLNSHRPEARNENGEKDTDSKQPRISVATHA